MNTQARRINKYELQELLGQDGTIETWKAFDTQAYRYVTMKLLHINVQTDTDFLARFQRISQLLTSLHHSNIAHYYDFAFSQQAQTGTRLVYTVAEYVDGRNLATYIQNTAQKGAFLSSDVVARFFASITTALDYLHRQGIVHGLLKPSNILLDKHNTTHMLIGEPIITDVGMTQLLRDMSIHTNEWQVNTAFYMSPEQIMGLPATERSDIYALGIMMYQLSTGTLPFMGNNTASVMTQQMNITPVAPNLIRPDVTPAMTTTIMRCIAKDPAARFPNAASLVEALATIGRMSSHTSGSLVPANTSQPYEAKAAEMPTVMSNISSISGIPGISPVSGMPASQLPQASMTPHGNEASRQGNTSFTPAGSSQQNSSIPYGGPVTPMPSVFVPAQSTPAMQSSSFTPVGSLTPAMQAAPATPFPPSVTAPTTQSFTQSTLSTAPASPEPPSASTSSTPPVQPFPAPLKPRGRRRGLWIALSALLVLALIGSSLGAYFTFFANHSSTAATSSVAGYAYFVSSGLLSSNIESNQGITDQLQIVMKNISPPPSGKSYYAWLLNDKTLDWKPILIGQLTVNNGVAVLSYPGDATHTNLLATNSRFIVTQEDATTAPVNPSDNPKDLVYYAEFSQTPNPEDPRHFSLYDHIRHLLANDPNVQKVGLTGGLDIWLYRNTQKVLEWAGSARDAQRAGGADFVRRQLTRILDYLDGTYFIQRDLDGQPLRVDPTIAKIGLLTFDPANQNPPGYVYHMDKHLHEVASLPQSTPAQKALAAQINQALNNVDSWFHLIRFDALHLYQMSDAQLLGSDGRTMLDNLATLANDAFTGQLNPQGQLLDGVVQIHYNIQRLATFDIQACTTSQLCPALV